MEEKPDQAARRGDWIHVEGKRTSERVNRKEKQINSCSSCEMRFHLNDRRGEREEKVEDEREAAAAAAAAAASFA